MYHAFLKQNFNLCTHLIVKAHAILFPFNRKNILFCRVVLFIILENIVDIFVNR